MAIPIIQLLYMLLNEKTKNKVNNRKNKESNNAMKLTGMLLSDYGVTEEMKKKRKNLEENDAT